MKLLFYFLSVISLLFISVNKILIIYEVVKAVAEFLQHFIVIIHYNLKSDIFIDNPVKHQSV